MAKYIGKTKAEKTFGGNSMKIINFEEAKERKHAKERIAKHLSEISDGELELERQYREAVQFYDRWYDEHVVGQDENGGWIYK